MKFHYYYILIVILLIDIHFNAPSNSPVVNTRVTADDSQPRHSTRQLPSTSKLELQHLSLHPTMTPLFTRLRPLSRHYATAAAATAPTGPSRLVYGTRVALALATVGGLSFFGGAYTLKQFIPGSGPIDTELLHLPGSPADTASVLASAAVIAASPHYRKLKADEKWVEADDVYSHLSADARKTKLLSGTLWGHRKVSANKVFFSVDGKESTSFLVLGTALCGHPNVIHGGVLATVLDEALGRLAIRQFPDGGAVTARLEVKYRAPTRAAHGIWNRDAYVVVTARVAELAERKCKVVGEIRDKEGKLLVQSEALFVVPKGWKPRPLGEH
jgi:acyl-coenzyme A thioesterase PaaI-like protein